MWLSVLGLSEVLGKGEGRMNIRLGNVTTWRVDVDIEAEEVIDLKTHGTTFRAQEAGLYHWLKVDNPLRVYISGYHVKVNGELGMRRLGMGITLNEFAGDFPVTYSRFKEARAELVEEILNQSTQEVDIINRVFGTLQGKGEE